MRWLGLVAIAFLASGCLADRSPAPTTAPPPGDAGLVAVGQEASANASAPLVPGSFNGTFAIELTEATAPGNKFTFNSAHCISVTAGTQIVAGSATATWQAPNAAAERLILGFEGGAGLEGTSPLVLDLAGYTTQDVHEQDDWLTVSVPWGTTPRAMVLQDIRVEVSFTYLAAEEIGVDGPHSCFRY